MKGVMFLLRKPKNIASSSNDDKKMQSTDSIEAYAYGTGKDLVSKKEYIKCNTIIKRYKKKKKFI